ncbi:MAG: alanine/glycine:cation symporter family protein [Chloroherpetonaceae bacterium]|nr:alanine:cation symporter family protein [Chloroherpetonaceae bacterium]MDW8018901.1 alanine/glycine:cation symporter family protein [Chloroherpetonaceae bacterium]
MLKTPFLTGFFLTLALGFSSSSYANASRSIDARINDAVAPFTDAISSVIFYAVPIGEVNLPLIIVWLIGGACIFTVYMGFINVRGFRHAIELVRGDYSDPHHQGEVSHFQALAAALSGTVGLGNIAGVAIAVSVGGPGATFWMILAGILGMSSKFVECTLGVKYRTLHSDGSVSGGPMYYLSKAFAARQHPLLGKFLAGFFAVMCIGGSLGAGNMFQVNQAFKQFVVVTGESQSILQGFGWLFGIFTAVLVALVIIGGIKSIVRVTDKIVPIMCGIYILATLAVLVARISDVPNALWQIVSGAFAPESVAGGALGAMIQGVRRAAFSNEAGIGSAAIAHSAVKTNEPITEGIVALLEPFIDTVVVCTCTALVIVVTGYTSNTAVNGVALTSAAFASVIAWFPYLLAVIVFLFAFSTMLSWSYYGLKAWTYLFGETPAMSLSYKLLFCLFVVIGATMSLDKVTDFSDAMIFAMSFPNLIGLYFLMPEVKRDLTLYLTRLRRGEIRRYR